MDKASLWEQWGLFTDKGRQVWKFAGEKSGDSPWWQSAEGKQLLQQYAEAFTYTDTNPSSADKVYRHIAGKTAQAKTQPDKRSFSDEKVQSAYNAAHKAIGFYETLQTEDGHMPGDYGGPMFLLPGLVITSYVTESPLPEPHITLMKRYMLNHQNEDGGWGLHIEGPSTMFGTALQYVALRLLGHPADAPETIKARTWLHNHGGVPGIPSWGKFYLSVLGVYEWQGCNSLFPEMWILPEALPFHPSRYWCHSRMVYLPMAYCFGHKVRGKITPLVLELRKELYKVPYEKVNWQKARDQCDPSDLYNFPSPLLKQLNKFTNGYEQMPIGPLRKMALNKILRIIRAEDEHTNFIDIGPVNQVINSICIWHAAGKDSAEFKKHYERWFDYLWLAEDGMKMNGYNGSQLWDTTFALQAVMEGKFEREFPEFVRKAYQFIDNTQIREEVRKHKKFYRHDSVGGWPFSTAEHGWPITDCTSEGLKSVLQVLNSKDLNFKPRFDEKWLKKSVDLILSFQNDSGGWASYEKTRGPLWLEKLNPSEVFGNIMIDHAYTECTSACIQALVNFQKHIPNYRSRRIKRAIVSGGEFLMRHQQNTGEWYGSWAVCFTYGTWFGMEGLLAAGLKPYNDNGRGVSYNLRTACNYLNFKQNADGGWGESYQSSIAKTYYPHAESQVVNTAWVLLSLMAANFPERKVIDRGIEFLKSKQLPNGDFPQQGISGVFNHTCMITYTSYRNVFPIWALSRYIEKYGNK